MYHLLELSCSSGYFHLGGPQSFFQGIMLWNLKENDIKSESPSLSRFSACLPHLHCDRVAFQDARFITKEASMR